MVRKMNVGSQIIVWNLESSHININIWRIVDVLTLFYVHVCNDPMSASWLPDLPMRTELGMFEERLWIKTSWTTLTCVRLLFSTCVSTRLLQVQRRSTRHRFDYVSWQKRRGVHHCVYGRMCVRASQCVLLGEPTRGTSDRRDIFFQRERNKSASKTIDSSSVRPARGLSPLWIPPLQVNPAVNPCALDPFLSFLPSWQ